MSCHNKIKNPTKQNVQTYVGKNHEIVVKNQELRENHELLEKMKNKILAEPLTS